MERYNCGLKNQIKIKRLNNKGDDYGKNKCYENTRAKENKV